MSSRSSTASLDIVAARTARQRRIRIADQDHFERTRVRGIVRPTRETETRLQPDPLVQLFNAGKIDPDERDAGLQIRAVYAAICGASLSRSGWPSEQRQPGRGGGMPQWLAIAYTDNWKPWADDLARRKPMLEITIDIVIDEQSCASVDRYRRWKHGKASALLCESLGLYATLLTRGGR